MAPRTRAHAHTLPCLHSATDNNTTNGHMVLLISDLLQNEWSHQTVCVSLGTVFQQYLCTSNRSHLSARSYILIWPPALGFPGTALQGHPPGPLGKVRGGQFLPRLCPLSRAGRGPSWGSQASRHTPIFAWSGRVQRPCPFHLTASFLVD